MGTNRNLVSLLDQKLVQYNVVTTARPSISSDGVDVTSWRSGGFSSPAIAVFLDCTGAANLTAPTGGTAGVELWGYRSFPGVAGQWFLIKSLAAAAATIALVGVDQGYAESVTLDLIGVFERLAVAATVSANVAIAKFAPIEAWR